MANIDYTVPGIVVAMQQPNDWACWATTTTIMKSWKDQSSYEITTVLGQIGQLYLAKFNIGDGLGLNEYPAYLQAAGLTAEGPQNYTIDGWADLLRDYGVLWVNVSSEDPTNKGWNHARVFYGIRGDGTADGTVLLISDPGKGRLYEQSFSSFITAYEDLIRAENELDPEARWSAVPQVIHY